MRLTPRLGWWFTRPRPDRRPASPQAAARLRLERLEDRALPSFGFGWASKVGGTSAEQGKGIAVDASGNLYVTGWFVSGSVNFDPNNTNPANPNNTLTDPNPGTADLQFVAKYTADQTFQWVTLLGRGNEASGKVAVDGAGNVYAAYADETDNATHVARLDAGSGTVRWNAAFPGSTSMSGAGVAVGPSGDAYVTGVNAASQNFVARLHTDASGNPVTVWDQPTGGSISTGSFVVVDGGEHVIIDYVSGSSLWMAKVDPANGSATWAGSVVGNYTGSAAALTADAAGNVYLAGTAQAGGLFKPSSVVVAKLTPAANGSLQTAWTDRFSSQSGATFIAGGVAVDGTGNVYAAGDFSGSVDFDPGSGQFVLKGQYLDAFVLKLDANGRFAWAADTVRGLVPSAYVYAGPIAVDATSPGAPNVYTTGMFRRTADFDPTAGTYSLTVNGGASQPAGDLFVSKLTQTSPLLAAGGPAAGAAAPRLTAADLQPIVAAAIDRWAAAGLDAARLDLLRHATVTIADLGGPYLGLADASARAVRIDDDAAGWSWFVDPTPRDDAEFRTPGDLRVRGRMDLLSAVSHELGHLIGLDDDHDAGHAADVMGDSLIAGTRRTPTANDVTPVMTPGTTDAVNVPTIPAPSSHRRASRRR